MKPGRITVWFVATIAAGLLAVPTVASAGPAAGPPGAPTGTSGPSAESTPAPSATDAAAPSATDAPLAAGALSVPLDPGALVDASAPADAAPSHPGGTLSWDNAAELDNRKDRRDRSRVAFAVENGRGDRLVARNRAVAHADCNKCRTVALAFQVGIFTGSAPSVSADNASVAINETCTACVTFAAAQQFLLVTDRPLRLTYSGQLRLAAVRMELHRLATSSATAAQIQAALPDIEAEVIDVLLKQTRSAHGHGLLRYRQAICDVLGQCHDRTRVQALS